MAGTIQAGTLICTLISSNSRSIEVDDIGVRSYAGGGGAFNYRNKIVDGRFDFWYEGTTQTTSGYGSDTMCINEHVGSSKTHSRQSLTPGVDLPSIEVPSAIYYSRTVVSTETGTGTGNYVKKIFRMEDVRTLAGKSSVLSFYARADSTKNIAIELHQHFSDTSSQSTPLGLVSLSTNWKRYEIKFDVPSMAGKTIDSTSNYLNITFWFDAGSSLSTPSSRLGQQSGTFDLACIQLEEGSVATPFEELPIEVSKIRVGRYYEVSSLGSNIMFMTNPAAYQRRTTVSFKVEKRINTPTIAFTTSTNTTYNAAPWVQYRGSDAFNLVAELAVNTGAVYCSLDSWSADARL